MSLKPLTNHRVNLHILSPVHIGTGQDLDPFSYIIQNNTLHMIDLVQWIESYPDPDSLYAMMNHDNYAVIRSFIAENFNQPDAVKWSAPIDSPTLISTYQKAIQEKNPANQVLISPMIRNPLTMEPCIPGSSIKGAIRTAIANQFVRTAGVTKDDAKPKTGKEDYNKKIFGNIKNDPLKYLKISDVCLGKHGTIIVEAKEYPLAEDKTLTPKGHLEAGAGLIHTGTPAVYPLQWSMAPFDIHRKKIDPSFILDALNRFYTEKYHSEFEKFYSRSQEIRQAMMTLHHQAAGLRTNEALIRIGHFSHVECVTLDDVRNPKTRKGKDGKPLPWGVTRTLANGLYPFGWAKIEFCDMISEPRPGRKWSFQLLPVSDKPVPKKAAAFEPIPAPAEKPIPYSEKPPETAVQTKPVKPAAIVEVLSPLEKILKEVSVIKTGDMGRLAAVIEKMETLQTDSEKGVLAKAVKEKMTPKQYKAHKKRAYFDELIRKAGA